MQTNRLNPGIVIIILGVVTFFTVLSLAKSPEFFLNRSFSIWGSIISLVWLLALCAISARIMLWAYSKIQLPQHPVRMFSYGFLISVAGILIGMVPGMLQGQYFMEIINDQFPNLPLSTGYTNYLFIGFKPVLFTCAIFTITLLWTARWKRTKDEPAALLSHAYRKHDILLIISTLIIYAFLIKDMLEFIISSFYIWRLGPIR
jgi:hypothetical protein